MIQILKMAFRDLGRNRRRTFFSALAVAVGLAILVLMAAVIQGEMGGAIEQAIRLQSGHIQLRAASYDESKSSLQWQDLVANPAQIAAQVAAMSQVKAATPRLFASGFISTGNESTGVQIYGIDPASPANDPYRAGMISGDYLTADDAEGILIGQPIAARLGLKAGDPLNLSVNTSNGDVQQQVFTVRGIYTTNTFAFDNGTILMPLAKAQALTQTQNHASTIFVLLKNTADTDRVAAALKGSGLKVLTWTDLNALIVGWETTAESYIAIFYLIILAITASVIINTLIMSVYERTREIGVLSAIGMKGGRIMGLFLAESSLLAVGGVIMGLVLGLLGVALFNIKGYYIGNMGLSGIMITNTIYARLTLSDTINVTLLTFVVTILSGLYPAVMASRLEPVAALRAEK
ncbi:MAG TPA: ABC transporter permease [Anaerolineales bacterium]|nr:ABC transporter permease [Anaerolineales bacterium]